MERSALYRRALAPIMTFAGLIGITAAVLGVFLRIESQTGFIGYWLSVAVIGIAGAFLLVRRQALKSAESFWSPPTRRVAQALLPPLTVGLFVGLCTFTKCLSLHKPGSNDDAGDLFWMTAVWAVFYGCALHSAGFSVSRGLRLFGWLFIAVGIGVLFSIIFLMRAELSAFPWKNSHWLMAGIFGVLHLAYGIYLYVTGEERSEL